MTISTIWFYRFTMHATYAWQDSTVKAQNHIVLFVLNLWAFKMLSISRYMLETK